MDFKLIILVIGIMHTIPKQDSGAQNVPDEIYISETSNAIN